MGKRGRPPKHGADPLTERIEFRALKSEKKRYAAEARKADLQLSDWIRARLNAETSSKSSPRKE